MRIGLVLAAAAALMVGGCSTVQCSGGATNGAEAGDCGLHTTFFGPHAQNDRAPAVTKS
jgi:hypothetical protein